MNAGNLKENIVIITTFDNKEFIIKTTLREWNEITAQAEAIGKKKIFLKDYNENLYFSTIKSERGKTLYKELPQPKKTISLLEMGSVEKKKLEKENPEKYYKMKKEEEEARLKGKKLMDYYLEKSKETRKKKFIEERNRILKKLEVTELNY
jgi:hypothetical protein